MSADKLSAVDDVIAQMIADEKIVGSVVAVARHGKVCYLKAQGQRDTEPADTMQTDTIFRIYSMTKAIVSAGALILVDDGVIKIDDPVTKYIPELEALRVQAGDELVPLTKPITVADLMRHTAGFTYGFGDDAIDQLFHKHEPLAAKDLAEMAERLKHIPLRNQPGEEWVYSVSIDMLGLVIERASGQPLDAFLEERIYRPLDMNDTGFYCPPEKAHRFAALYLSEDGGPLRRAGKDDWGRQFDKPPTLLSGGGGLVSTARDYLHFLMMVQNGGELFGQRVLKPETVALMTTDQLPAAAFPIGFGDERQPGVGFGYGFSVRVSPDEGDPHRPVDVYGWSGAASTHYWVDPAQALIVVTLEQRRPFTTDTMDRLKPLVNDAVVCE